LESKPIHSTPSEAAVADWRSWMREQRGLTEKTIAARCHYAVGLLDVLTAADRSVSGGVWTRRSSTRTSLSVDDLTALLLVLTSSDLFRCLLRWALSTGRLDRT